MARITLTLTDYRSIPELPVAPTLELVEFQHPLLPAPRRSFRGKGFADPLSSHTFLWSPAVRAMTVLLLRIKSGDPAHAIWPTRPLIALGGGAGSAAASLDYALSKKPLWLLDMFGVNSHGQAISQTLFMRWNPERKRGGDVFIAGNPAQLCGKSITVVLNGMPLSEDACAVAALRIEHCRHRRAAGPQCVEPRPEPVSAVG